MRGRAAFGVLLLAPAVALPGCGAAPDPSPSAPMTPALPTASAESAEPGDLIAFVRDSGDGVVELVLRDLTSDDERVLAVPAGSRPIAFTRDRAMLVVAEPTVTDPAADAFTTHLALYPTDGGERVDLLDTFTVYAPPTHSPDGRYLAFSSDGAAPNGIVIVDLETGEAWQHTTDGAKGSPRWSPDSRWIAYEAFHAGGGVDAFQNDAFVVEVSTGAVPRAITGDRFNDTPIGWTDDGRSVIIWTDRDTPQTKLSFTAWTVEVDSGAAERRGDLAPDGPIAVASPNGRWDAVFSFAGFLELQRSDGSVERHVLDRAADAGTHLSWSPSGGWLVWNARVDGVLDLFMVRVPDGEPGNLTRTPNADELYPVWGPVHHDG